MTIAVSVWAFPIILTILSYIHATVKSNGTHSRYGFSELYYFGGFVVQTLVVWLVFFAIMYFAKP